MVIFVHTCTSRGLADLSGKKYADGFPFHTASAGFPCVFSPCIQHRNTEAIFDLTFWFCQPCQTLHWWKDYREVPPFSSKHKSALKWKQFLAIYCRTCMQINCTSLFSFCFVCDLGKKKNKAYLLLQLDSIDISCSTVYPVQNTTIWILIYPTVNFAWGNGLFYRWIAVTFAVVQWILLYEVNHWIQRVFLKVSDG